MSVSTEKDFELKYVGYVAVTIGAVVLVLGLVGVLVSF